jgi:PTS system galactitol-specific IIA component
MAPSPWHKGKEIDMGAVDTSLLKPELVYFDFEAENANDFFAKMEKLLAPKGYIKPTWLKAIQTREANYPTGLQFDDIAVAIPHVEPENIAKPYIAIVKPKSSIPFKPMADMVDHLVETQLIINLGLVSHDEDQVAVLQAMMGIFTNPDSVKEILSQDSGEGMVDCFKRLFGE